MFSGQSTYLKPFFDGYCHPLPFAWNLFIKERMERKIRSRKEWERKLRSKKGLTNLPGEDSFATFDFCDGRRNSSAFFARKNSEEISVQEAKNGSVVYVRAAICKEPFWLTASTGRPPSNISDRFSIWPSFENG